MSVNEIKQIANDNGWRYVKAPKSKALEFKQMEKRILVYPNTMTIETEIKHPRYGWTRMRREKLDATQIRLIFHYPRIHTDKGYYIKSQMRHKHL